MDSHFPLHQILERYGINSRANIHNLSLGLNQLGVNADFITAVLKVFEEENNTPVTEFDNFSLRTVIDYIRKTHRYYLFKKLPEIEQSIGLLLQDYSETHPLLALLRDFFTGYQKDLTTHIMAEEKHLLPYIEKLLKVEEKGVLNSEFFFATKNYSIQRFMQMHDDTEEDLADIRNTILLYEPPKTNRTPYNILLSQLSLFEKDLNVHAFIEDRVLMLRAGHLEREWMKKMQRKATRN